MIEARTHGIAIPTSPTRQAEHAADRAPACDLADPAPAYNPQDALLFPINPHADLVIGLFVSGRMTTSR
jgi:hypothetical protein